MDGSREQSDRIPAIGWEQLQLRDNRWWRCQVLGLQRQRTAWAGILHQPGRQLQRDGRPPPRIDPRPAGGRRVRRLRSCMRGTARWHAQVLGPQQLRAARARSYRHKDIPDDGRPWHRHGREGRRGGHPRDMRHHGVRAGQVLGPRLPRRPRKPRQRKLYRLLRQRCRRDRGRTPIHRFRAR